jgi:predicted transcriptional regulator
MPPLCDLCGLCGGKRLGRRFLTTKGHLNSYKFTYMGMFEEKKKSPQMPSHFSFYTCYKYYICSNIKHSNQSHKETTMTKRAFGELESQILYLLKSGERKTVKEIHKLLGGQDNYNTIMTVMSRLAEKKQLSREKMGLHYEYWILQQPNFSSYLNSLKQKFFGVKTSALVSHLIDSADDLSDEDLDNMEKLLKQTRECKKK